MKKFIFLFFLSISFGSFAQNIGTEVLSFYNGCVTPTTDSGGVVIKTKLPFGAPRYMPTIVIEGYNYGTIQSIGLMINFYVFNGGSGEYFAQPRVSSHGGYAPDVYLFNDAGFVSIFLKRGTSQYCLSFKVRAWLRIPTDGGATSSWFTDWSASSVNTPPAATNNYIKINYQNTMGELTTTSDAYINGLRIGAGRGISNLGIGTSNLGSITTGSNNVALGQYNLHKLTTGGSNTAVGGYALLETVAGEGSVAVGFEAMRGSGASATPLNTFSVGVGARALRGNISTPSVNTGVNNTALGSDALYSNESGSHNMAAGYYSLYKNKKGIGNVAIGNHALQENVAKSYNTAVGIQSQFYANSSNTEDDSFNNSTGAFSLRGSENPSANTGIFNNAYGGYALYSNTSGNDQSAFGMNTLRFSTGHFNSAFGSHSGYDLTTGTSNTFIGQNTGRGITTGSGNTVIGAGLTGLSATLTNTVVLGAGNVEKMRINQSGNVGIATTNPTEKLTVAGDIYATHRLTFQDNARFTVTSTHVSTLNTTPFSMPQYGLAAPSTSGSADLWISGHQAIRMFNGGNPEPSFNLVGGNLGIGTQTIPAGYRFAVKGNVIAEKIVVKTSTSWPDFVFKKDYQLPSLNEVEQFIAKNSHLPEIPSAKEVENNGQDVGEMNRLLLKKVEEITLYLIELKKENQEIKKENQEMKKENDSLKRRIEKLEK